VADLCPAVSQVLAGRLELELALMRIEDNAKFGLGIRRLEERTLRGGEVYAP
jgi:hypothetical protein